MSSITPAGGYQLVYLATAAAARPGAAAVTATGDDDANADTHTDDRPYGCPRSDSLFQFLDFEFQAFHDSLQHLCCTLSFSFLFDSPTNLRFEPKSSGSPRFLSNSEFVAFSTTKPNN